MKKDQKDRLLHDEQGVRVVSEQIMDAYNGGVIDQENGQFDLSQHSDYEE